MTRMRTRRGRNHATAAAAAGAGASRPGALHLGVVITGATKGVGFALAREFLAAGDRVCICGRSQTRVDAAIAALRREFPGRALHVGPIQHALKAPGTERLKN